MQYPALVRCSYETRRTGCISETQRGRVIYHEYALNDSQDSYEIELHTILRIEYMQLHVYNGHSTCSLHWKLPTSCIFNLVRLPSKYAKTFPNSRVASSLSFHLVGAKRQATTWSPSDYSLLYSYFDKCDCYRRNYPDMASNTACRRYLR